MCSRAWQPMFPAELCGRVLLLYVGLIIINAHHVAETSGEGFAVRLYRQGTAQGFDPSSTPGNKEVRARTSVSSQAG